MSATEMDDTHAALSPLRYLSILAYITLLQRTVFICVYAVVRIQWNYEHESQSVFDNNRVFRMIGIVSLSAAALVAVILWCAGVFLRRPMRDVDYTVLKFVGSFSAFLAPFSLLMVLILPPELNWIAYLAVCVMFGMLVACFYLEDQKQEKSQSVIEFLVKCLVFVLLNLVFFIPDSLSWIVYRVIYAALGMETAYHFFTYSMFINEKAGKPRNLEDHKVAQPEKNENYPPMNYLQMIT